MKNIEFFFSYLEKLFPQAKCELNFSSPFEMLVAVMLSAQCTDKRVNIVTKELFKKYNSPKDFACLDTKKLEGIIRPCGFYHSKAKNIINMSKQLLTNYNGEIPKDPRDMEKLAGVGRKTANVVASELFDSKVIGVDTHIFRVLNRVGFACEKTPEKTEFAFVKKYPNYLGREFHYRMVLFGRYYCTARNPKCENCELKGFCKFYLSKKQA